jgi:thioredoxin reductase
MKDDLPATPGVNENWGKGIYWCPWCDGHEHADQALGIIAPLDQGATTVREILTLNDDVVVLVNGTDTPERRATTDQKFPGWQQYLQLHNIEVDNRTISSIVRIRNGTTGQEDPSLPTHAEHDLFRVNFETGEPILRNAFLTAFPEEQKSKLGQETGVALYGTKLAADNSMGLVTNIPGIFAIGDCNSDNVTNVPHATFSGKRTAVFLHGE